MKHEVKIPKRIKVGGFDYRIGHGTTDKRKLSSNNRIGEQSGYCQEILLDHDCKPQRISEVFIHEVIHAVNNIYNDSNLSERDVNCIGNGLHQVFEQLGVRFTLK